MPYALNVFVVCHNLILTQYWNYCYQLNPETFIKKEDLSVVLKQVYWKRRKNSTYTQSNNMSIITKQGFLWPCPRPPDHQLNIWVLDFFLTNSTVHFWALSYIYFCFITYNCCTLHCPLLFFEWHTKPTETSHFTQLYPYYSNVSLIIVDSVPWDHPPNLQALQRTHHSWETSLKYTVSWTEAVWTWSERLIWEMKKKCS